jgi:hypothetical protein
MERLELADLKCLQCWEPGENKDQNPTPIFKELTL